MLKLFTRSFDGHGETSKQLANAKEQHQYISVGFFLISGKNVLKSHDFPCKEKTVITKRDWFWLTFTSSVIFSNCTDTTIDFGIDRNLSTGRLLFWSIFRHLWPKVSDFRLPDGRLCAQSLFFSQGFLLELLSVKRVDPCNWGHF